MLIGEAGVGKTAIVEGLAQEIANGNVPEILRDKQVVTLDLALMVAGTKYRGQFEERIKAVMDEIRKVKNVILFIDELHTIVGAGSAEGAMDASNIIKPALSRAELQCVGATTLNEYRKYIEKDAALERRFQQVKVEEPSVDDAIKILQGLQEKYEAHHKAKFTPEAIEAAVQLTARYLTGRFLPDKAIDVLDEAGARARIGTMTRPPAIKEIEAQHRADQPRQGGRHRRAEFRKGRRPARRGEARQEETRGNPQDTGAPRSEETIVTSPRTTSWRSFPNGPACRSAAWRRRKPRNSSRWRTNSRAASSARTRRSSPSPRRCAAPAPTSRIRAARSARSCSSAPPASARPTSPATSPSSCSAMPTR